MVISYAWRYTVLQFQTHHSPYFRLATIWLPAYLDLFALGMLLADRVVLSGEVTVTRLVRLPGQLQVSLVRTASPGEGTLTLYFADAPLALRQWVVVDQQGKLTRVSLTNLDTSAHVDPKLFEYHDDSNGAAGG